MYFLSTFFKFLMTLMNYDFMNNFVLHLQIFWSSEKIFTNSINLKKKLHFLMSINSRKGNKIL